MFHLNPNSRMCKQELGLNPSIPYSFFVVGTALSPNSLLSVSSLSLSHSSLPSQCRLLSLFLIHLSLISRCSLPLAVFISSLFLWSVRLLPLGRPRHLSRFSSSRLLSFSDRA
ncbi:hypothetical protein Syun_025848 [Stephania yunnanensis]|uniref:Uncharacterized protein n=1 Tax=Stephania yunnanensis TaxID=152371 RepID=A0AAP0HRN3_9MAGN